MSDKKLKGNLVTKTPPFTLVSSNIPKPQFGHPNQKQKMKKENWQ
jgi:hypothetical protein